MALLTAAAGAASLFGSAKKIFSPISSLFGGSSCSESQKQQRREIADAIRTYLSPGDMRNLVSGMESNVAANPDAMARFFLGGGDCKHKNVTPGDQRFLDRLPLAIQQAQQEKKSQSNNQSKAAFAPTVTENILGAAGSNQTGLILVGLAALFLFLNRKAILGQ